MHTVVRALLLSGFHHGPLLVRPSPLLLVLHGPACPLSWQPVQCRHRGYPHSFFEASECTLTDYSTYWHLNKQHDARTTKLPCAQLERGASATENWPKPVLGEGFESPRRRPTTRDLLSARAGAGARPSPCDPNGLDRVLSRRAAVCVRGIMRRNGSSLSVNTQAGGERGVGSGSPTSKASSGEDMLPSPTWYNPSTYPYYHTITPTHRTSTTTNTNTNTNTAVHTQRSHRRNQHTPLTGKLANVTRPTRADLRHWVRSPQPMAPMTRTATRTPT